MPLVNASKYFQTKSIKLSDSFIVRIDGKESFRCAAFTVPKIAEWNEEEYKFGNVSQKFLIPKIDLNYELTLELYEGYDPNGKKKEGTLHNKKLFFGQKHDGQSIGNGFYSVQDYTTQGYTQFNGQYNLANHDFKELDIFILNNRLSHVVYEYHFHNLKLTKAEPYELSYQDESLTKWSLGFTFESMEKGAPDNPIPIDKVFK